MRLSSACLARPARTLAAAAAAAALVTAASLLAQPAAAAAVVVHDCSFAGNPAPRDRADRAGAGLGGATFAQNSVYASGAGVMFVYDQISGRVGFNVGLSGADLRNASLPIPNANLIVVGLLGLLYGCGRTLL
jgi:hypothetical protein